MKSFIVELFASKIFLSVFISMMISNCIKILTNWIITDKIDLSVFYKTGGMPSSHAATVISLTTSIYLETSVSPLFIASVVFSSIVLTDAVGVRRSAGKQAALINEIMKDIKLRKFRVRMLYEILGHTPRQVLAGSIMGIIVANIVYFVL